MPKADPEAPVTREVLDSALEHVIETIGGMTASLRDEMKKRFDQVDERFDSLEAKVAENSRKIDDLKQDLALTSERKETKGLERRVQRLEGFHAH